MSNEDIRDYTGDELWNAIYTVQLGELVENGVFDWSSDVLNWESAAYSPEQYERVCNYFIERYRYREISTEPYLEWALMLKRKLVYELMPKYKPLYEIFENGINPLQKEDVYFKSRIVDSEYPETLLSANSDYASYGKDEENEKVTEGNIIEALSYFTDAFKGIDEMLVDELECMFVSLYTMNVNAL